VYLREPGFYGLGEPVTRFDGTSLTESLRGLAQVPAVLPPSAWQDLISFVPPVAIQRQILQRGLPAWAFHRIEDAVGQANLDYYAVRVSRLPQVKGFTLSATALLTLIRLNLNDFIDKRLTAFAPFGASDKKLWNSSNPLGSVLHLDFYRLIGRIIGSIPIDDGSVVVSDFTPAYWRVYTIWTAADQGHPVSGVREWGYRPDGDGHVFYTRAADRLTKSLLLPFKDDVYAAQHTLWMSFQRAIEMFVNANNGQAAVLPPMANRYDWAQLAGQYHRPTVPWVTA
jgi:hypothetical protein